MTVQPQPTHNPAIVVGWTFLGYYAGPRAMRLPRQDAPAKLVPEQSPQPPAAPQAHERSTDHMSTATVNPTPLGSVIPR